MNATTDITTKQPKDFPTMLKQFLPEIGRALPSHLSGDRMARIALTAFRRTPKLAECDPRSVFAAVIQASQLGLEPDTLGRAYIIPYKVNKKVGNQWESHYEAQFIPGWKGLVDLVSRSGQAIVWTGAVYQGDKFEYQLGDDPKCIHIPGDLHGEGEPTHFYACGKVKGADTAITEVWSMARVKRHLTKYNKVGESHYAFANMEMYGRKVVLLQVLKYMPMSTELVRAVELDHAATKGEQGLNMNDAIAGEWSPVPETETVIGETGKIKPAQLPECTPEQFAEFAKEYEAPVRSKKLKAAKVVKTLSTTVVLTDAQKLQISAWESEAD